MIDLGAEVNEEEAKVLVEYLAKNWPVKGSTPQTSLQDKPAEKPAEKPAPQAAPRRDRSGLVARPVRDDSRVGRADAEIASARSARGVRRHHLVYRARW